MYIAHILSSSRLAAGQRATQEFTSYYHASASMANALGRQVARNLPASSSLEVVSPPKGAGAGNYACQRSGRVVVREHAFFSVGGKAEDLEHDLNSM
jgi:hypothetical protein